MRWKILDIQITSLLGSLVPYNVPFLFDFSVSFLQSVPQIQFCAVAHVFIFETFDGLVSALGSIFSILPTRIIKTHKSKLSKFVFLEDQGLDVTELGKHFPDVFFCHVDWNIFDINIVHELSDVPSLSGLELDWDGVRMQGCFVDSFGGRVFVIETHESVASA